MSNEPEESASEGARGFLKVADTQHHDDGNAVVSLGARVREIRRARNWTLEEAARRAGLARSTLSKIENEQMSPTYDAVQKLARGLGITPPQLFAPARVSRATGRRTINRAGQGRHHDTATYAHEILAGEITRKQMLPYKARIVARSFDDFGGWVRHEGEEFMLVLSGSVRFFTEYYEAVDLHVGDSAYYDAAMGHCVISISPEDAEILWVTTVT